MKLLLDTHLLLWSAFEPRKLPATVRGLLQDESNLPQFSAASIWEVAIKSALGREDFNIDPSRLRRGLIDNGWEEMAITGAHAAATRRLPPLHRDPFDRLLVAQADIEGIALLTADEMVARYGGPARLVHAT